MRHVIKIDLANELDDKLYLPKPQRTKKKKTVERKMIRTWIAGSAVAVQWQWQVVVVAGSDPSFFNGSEAKHLWIKTYGLDCCGVNLH